MARKIYVLKPLLPNQENGPWNPWYDKCFGCVVIAKHPNEARNLAAENCGAEGKEPWANADLTSCEVLKAGTQSIVVISDVHSA